MLLLFVHVHTASCRRIIIIIIHERLQLALRPDLSRLSHPLGGLASASAARGHCNCTPRISAVSNHSPSLGELLQSSAPLKSAARKDEWLRTQRARVKRLACWELDAHACAGPLVGGGGSRDDGDDLLRALT